MFNSTRRPGVFTLPAALVAALLACCVVAQGALADSSVSLCVPSTAGQAIVSGGSIGTCSSGQTPVSLPSSSAEQQTLLSILPHMSLNPSGVAGKPTIRFSGVNVQVVSGSGSTSGTVNGEGNLIVGYAEDNTHRAQTGSNDLVVGADNGWTGFGELVGGNDDLVSGPFATAFGQGNVASGPQSSTLGGLQNTASGEDSSVTGGAYNIASGEYGSVAGGYSDTATAFSASATGGVSNHAVGDYAAVNGGGFNTASDIGWVGGGQGNTASGQNSSVAGGFDNDASDTEGSILGGCGNLTGVGPNPHQNDCELGDSQPIANTVVGGTVNNASGMAGVVAGGNSNIANGTWGAFVGGGFFNQSIGSSTSILGGAHEELSAANESQAGATQFSP